jgi:hypothetical protein
MIMFHIALEKEIMTVIIYFLSNGDRLENTDSCVMLLFIV